MSDIPSQLPWWLLRSNQMRLIKWALALLQGRKYRIFLRAEGSGYHDQAHHKIQANPEMFSDELIETQFRATQGILAHEVGHALFTDAWPDQSEGVLRQLVNCLEDERIERAMCTLYPGIAPAIVLLGDLLHARRKKHVYDRDYEYVLSACLTWRWAHRRESESAFLRFAGLEHETTCELWAEVRSLVEEAWSAPNTDDVIRLGHAILDKLSIPEHYAPLEAPIDGLPQRDIPRERGDTDGVLSFPSEPANVQPGLGSTQIDHADAGTHGNGSMPKKVEPQSYIDLEDRALPLARRLASELYVPTPDRTPVAVEHSGRYSFRQKRRTPQTPYLHEEEVGNDVPLAALYVLADRSGSMDVVNEEVQLALMTLLLAARQLSIPLGIAYFGDDDEVDPVDVILDFNDRGESPKAYIAGYMGHTSAEFLHWGFQVAEAKLATRPERRKIIVVIHDGQPVWNSGDLKASDWALSCEDVAHLTRRGWLVAGIYLGDSDAERKKLDKLFASKLIACKADRLPEKLGGFLRLSARH